MTQVKIEVYGDGKAQVIKVDGKITPGLLKIIYITN